MLEPQDVEASTQLLVEGNDQVNFFEALVNHMRISGIQIQNFGGVGELTPFVETLAAGQDFRTQVESVGIVRDAESKAAQSAFQSAQASLRRAGLPVPERMNQRFGNTPAVSVFILPDNQSSGMLETLLCKTLEGTQMGDCIDDFLECVTTSIGEGLRRPDKSRAFAYISTMSQPNVSVGVAAKKSYWDLDHAVFGGVRDFLRSLKDFGYMTNQNDHCAALSKVRICDFTGQLAGAGATRVLAAFGAQVIRVEDRLRQGQWDIFRGNGPWMDDRRGINLGGTFNNHNVEKLGVTLDMRKPKATEILKELISVSDAVTENFSKGVLARWGFSYEEMVKIKPDIIYVSNCGFGHVGPYSEYKTWGPIVQAVSGLTFQSGLPDMPPAGWGYSYMDHTGGYLMAIAILMALYHRHRTGVGQWIDMSCTDGAAALNGPAMLDYTVNGVPARRPGNPNSNRSIYPKMAPHGIYRCEGDDNWVGIAVRNDDDWSALCEAIEADDIESDHRLATVEGRIEHHDEIDERIEAWTSVRSPMLAMEALQARRVPAGAVQRPVDRIDNDPNTKEWGLFPTVDHPEMGKVRVDGMPIKLSETPARIERGGPILGQHNQEVFAGVLGMDQPTVDALTEEGVF